MVRKIIHTAYLLFQCTTILLSVFGMEESRLFDNTLEKVKYISSYPMFEDTLTEFERIGKEHVLQKKVTDKTEQVCRLIIKLYYSKNLDSKTREALREEIMETFRSGADINGSDNIFYGSPFLHSAVEYQDYTLTNFLLERGADINIRNNFGATPLIYIVAMRDNKINFEMIRYLLDKGADIHAATEYDGSAMSYAASKINLELMQLLLDYGADINDKCGTEDESPLSISAWRFEKKNPKLPGYLIAMGAEFDEIKDNKVYISGTSTGASGPISYSAAVPVSNVLFYRNLIRTQAVIRTILYHSFLVYDKDFYRYHPARAFDGDLLTGWIEGDKDAGTGRGIGITLDRKITIDEIRVAPGYFDKRWYKDNNRVKKMTIQLNDVQFDHSFKDEMTIQSIKLGKEVTFNYALFIVQEVYRSQVSNDTAIAEITFYYHGNQIKIHSGKIRKFLRNISQDKVLKEIQDEVYVTSNIYTSEYAKAPQLKLSQNHFKTILQNLRLPDESIVWKDENGNGVAEISELNCANLGILKKLWDFSGRVTNDLGLSSLDYQSEIIIAVAEDNKEVLKSFLANEIDIYYKYNYNKTVNKKRIPVGNSYLSAAAAGGNIEMLEYFTKLGLFPDRKPKSYYSPYITPLSVAILNKQYAAVKWLLDNGANINYSPFTGLYAIMSAIEADDPEMVKYLVGKGANIEVKNDEQQSLLLISAYYGNMELVKYFSEKGLSLHDRDKNGNNAVLLAALMHANENLVLYLIKEGVDCTLKYPDGNTLLFRACRLGWLKTVTELVEKKGININGEGADSIPLMSAAGHGRYEVVEYLLKKGAKVNIKDDNGMSPLFDAAYSEHIKVVKLLLKYKADPNVYDGFEHSLVELLTLENKDPHYFGRDQDNNLGEIIGLLIEAGADPYNNE